MSITAKEIWNSLNAITAALTWLASRGIHRDRALALLQEAEGSDITTEQCQALLDESAGELTETQEMILDKMTIAELKEFAAEKEIAIPADVTLKADILEHIKAALTETGEDESE